MAIGDTYKTGEKSPANANYRWKKYTDGSRFPEPTEEEKFITLEKEERFPPINSVDKAAYWVLSSYN
jgi:hypothetical protein